MEPFVDGPFLLFLGDVYFEADDLSQMTSPLARDDVDAVLAVHRAEPEAIRHNFSVEVGRGGIVRRVVEKPRNPTGDLKGCGVYAFRPSIFDAIRRTPRTALRNEYELTDAIQILVDDGRRVQAVSAVSLDFNLSEPYELLALNLHCLRRSGDERFVAADAELSPDARVDTSVVLSRARVEAGAALTRCLVMPGERVRRGAYEDVIFIDGDEIRCR